MSLRFKVAMSNEERRIHFRMRYQIMGVELGWFDIAKHFDYEERDEYDEKQSVIFIARDGDGNVIGTSRLILQGEIPLPIERHFELYPMERLQAEHGSISAYAEGGRFIVPPNPTFKRNEVSRLMVDGLMEHCIGLGLSHVAVSFDHIVYRLMRMLHYDFRQIGEAKVYMGSKTVPTIMSLAPHYANRLIVV